MGAASFDLNLLPVLAAVLEERSVTRAADRLHMSQSAVSHALRRLRTALDDDLVVRTGNAMHLTPEGERLAAELPDLVDRIEQSVRPDTFESAKSTQSFVLALPDALVSVVGPALVRQFYAEAPQRLVFQPLRPTVGEELGDGSIDAAIAAEGSWPLPLHSSALFALDWGAAVAADHPFRGDMMTLAEVARYPHVDTESSFLRPVLEGAARPGA